MKSEEIKEINQFNSRHKAIKMPKGAAAEYAKYSCNFYKGCSNECTYCFNNRWNWGDVPVLKKCFKNENHALEIFEKELKANLPELQKHGLFFSFTTDPMLPETIKLTTISVAICVENKIPVKILTKTSDFFIPVSEDYHGMCMYKVIWGEIMHDTDLCGSELYYEFGEDLWYDIRDYVSIGFTLTGYDDLEPNASTNAERIESMQKLHEAGFKTWASIEPVIDFEKSLQMIKEAFTYCDLYKIGLQSGRKYDKKLVSQFVKDVTFYIRAFKIYFKDSLLKEAGINRWELPNNCVGRDWNIFDN